MGESTGDSMGSETGGEEEGEEEGETGAGSEGDDEGSSDDAGLPELVDLPAPDDSSTSGDESADSEGLPPGDEDSGACLEFSDALAPIPPSVLFVLDRSGSMMDGEFDEQDPGKTRWQALYESVEGLLMQDEFDSIMEFGAKTFSTKGWGACGVAPGIDVDFALDNGGSILDELPPGDAWVNGGTPTQAALEISLDYLRGYDAEGSKAVILVTDGSIGCAEDDDAALAEITGNINAARELDGISTFVVGIAPKWNSTKAQLEAMAQAGGSETYLKADDADALSSALADVVAASYADSCYLQLDEAPNFPDLVEVEVDGQYWDEVQDCEASDGWVWDNDQLTRLRLCNAACDALVDTQEANVEFHCHAG